MEIPTYVIEEEVQRVCKILKIRDWAALAEAGASGRGTDHSGRD